MSTNVSDEPTIEMEKRLIEQYLNDQGYTSKKLKVLPERVVNQLMREATRYAAIRMEEIKASAREIHEGVLHHN